nr:hypothetical protein [Tanacetum cinerariifolium]
MQVPQRSNEDVKLEMAKLIKNNRIFFNDNVFPHEEASMELLNDSRTIDEMLKQREQAANLAVQQEQEEQAAQSFTPYFTTVLPTEEPEYSLSMGYEHLNTIPKTESDEVTESSAKNLLPIPSEFEVTFDDENKCDVPDKDESSSVFTTFSNPFFDNNDDFTSSDDESLSDEDVPIEEFKVYTNPLFDDDEINSDEIDSHCFNAESDFVESLFNRDTLIDSSLKIDFLEEFSGAFMPTSIADEERIRREHAEYIILMERFFTINLCPRPMENPNTIIETLPTSPILLEDSDSQREEIDTFTGTDDLLPPSIKSDNYDSERDIHFLEELLVDDSIPIPENESSNFDHHDNPSFPRLPPEPSDVEIFFKPNAGVLTTNVVKGISDNYVLMPKILSTLPPLILFIQLPNPVEDYSDIGSPEADGPPSPDYVPGLEEPEQAPPSPVYLPYVPELVYLEYMPLEDDVFPAEEQPLPVAATPTADSLGFILEFDPNGDPNEDEEEDPKEDPADYPANSTSSLLISRFPRVVYRFGKRLRFASPTPSQEVGESSAAGAARQNEPAIARDDPYFLVREEIYGFVDRVDVDPERPMSKKLGYGITDTWDELETTIMYGMMEEAQDGRSQLRGRVNLLYKDRSDHRHLAVMVEREARMAHEAWGLSMDASDNAHSDVMSLRTTLVAQHVLIKDLQAADRRRQWAIKELLAADHKRQVQLTKALRLLKGLQTQMIEFQKHHGPAKGLAQPDAPGEADSSS